MALAKAICVQPSFSLSRRMSTAAILYVAYSMAVWTSSGVASALRQKSLDFFDSEAHVVAQPEVG